jgi:hypothetical protein
MSTIRRNTPRASRRTLALVFMLTSFSRVTNAASCFGRWVRFGNTSGDAFRDVVGTAGDNRTRNWALAVNPGKPSEVVRRAQPVRVACSGQR